MEKEISGSGSGSGGGGERMGLAHITTSSRKSSRVDRNSNSGRGRCLRRVVESSLTSRVAGILVSTFVHDEDDCGYGDGDAGGDAAFGERDNGTCCPDMPCSPEHQPWRKEIPSRLQLLWKVRKKHHPHPPTPPSLPPLPLTLSVVCRFEGGAPWTEVAPGPLTVTWRETISHSGAPVRFALSVGGDCEFESLVLLDHVPHNDVDPTPITYRHTINIPDVDCTGSTPCALQLVSIMTDKIPAGTTCNQLGNVASPSCFSVYHSVANIRITGTVAPATFLASYTYTPPAGWPNPVPNAWGSETGTWTNGWLNGQSTVVQGDACTQAPPPPPGTLIYPKTCAECGYPSNCGSPAAPAPPAPPSPPPSPPSPPGAPTTGSASATGAASATAGNLNSGSANDGSDKDDKIGSMSKSEFSIVIGIAVGAAVIVAAIVAFVLFKARPSHAPSSNPYTVAAAPSPTYLEVEMATHRAPPPKPQGPPSRPPPPRPTAPPRV